MTSAAGPDLPAPQHVEGRGLVDDARRTVQRVAELVNDHAGPTVARLRGERLPL